MSYKYVEKKDQYRGIDFKIQKIIEAQYTEDCVQSGNRFIEALPTQLTETALFNKCVKLLGNHDSNKAISLTKEEKEVAIEQLTSIRIPSPYLYRIYKGFYSAIKSTYQTRELRLYNISINHNNEEERVAFRSISNEDGDLGNGITILGSAGTGKSTLIKMVVDQFPQLIMHTDEIHGRFLQIPYIKISCLPNSNLTAMLDSFGAELDKILHNTVPVYENEIKRQKSIGNKINVVSRLIEVFNIGMLILDEIQLMDFNSTKEASFEAILTITNNTKISLITLGTEDAYQKMFPNLRTARRTGMLINLDNDKIRIEYFKEALKILWCYQWFDERITKIPQEVGEGLFIASGGTIAQLVKVYMQMQLDYIHSKNKPEINKEYVFEIAKKYYPGIIKLTKNKKLVNSITSERALTSREISAISKVKETLNYINQTYNNDHIENAVRIAYDRSPNSDIDTLVKAAYKHLTRRPSDERRTSRSILDIDEERETLLGRIE